MTDTERPDQAPREVIFEMIAEGDIIGFKRTSTFARWGIYNHAEASFDVFVDASYHDPSKDREIQIKVADFLNTDPHFIRIVAEEMCDGDYPDHIGGSAA